MTWSARLLVAAAVVAAASFVTVATAAAAPFVVNSTLDAGDATLNGTCDDGAGHCTLRAAIQEANNTAAADSITFDSSFDGTTAATITLGSTLPALIHQASISGTGCTSGGAPKPCVALKGDGTFDGVTMGAGSSGSTVAGLDLFKLRTGVVDSDGGGIIQGNWFGIDLAGSPTSNANTNGVRVLGNSGTIGGTTAATRNVFANDSATGLSIEGGDSNTVTGNYFGTTPAGALDTNLSNKDSIAVATIVGRHRLRQHDRRRGYEQQYGLRRSLQSAGQHGRRRDRAERSLGRRGYARDQHNDPGQLRRAPARRHRREQRQLLHGGIRGD